MESIKKYYNFIDFHCIVCNSIYIKIVTHSIKSLETNDNFKMLSRNVNMKSYHNILKQIGQHILK